MVESLECFRYSDGYLGYVHVYRPEAAPRARLLFLHGIRSHAGWYQRSSRALAERGFEVHFLNRRGSGLNTARRGDTPDYHRWIADVLDYTRRLRDRQAWLPAVLAGISWGAKPALAAAALCPAFFHGVALLCPGLQPEIQPPWTRRLRIALARFLRPERTFPIPLNDPELFTSNPRWQQFLQANAHDLHEATARFLFESFRLDLFLKRTMAGVRCPILVQLAGRDRIISNTATRRYLTRLARARSLCVIDYPTADHTLEFEAVDHPWLQDLCEWLERRVLPSQAATWGRSTS